MNIHTLTITATKELFLVARLAVMLRKYGLDIQSLNISQATADGLSTITLSVVSSKSDISVAVKKLERLVPVAQVTWNT